MDLKEIKELIALMRKNDLSEFKLEQEGFKIKLRRGIDFPSVNAHAPAMFSGGGAFAAGNPPPEPPAVPVKPAEVLREIVSPMVGTFYAAASPDSPPYASAGMEVNEDSVVCIIEAMKVMNEIKSEVRGTIVEVVVENGKPVQFGQVLFRVR